MPTGPGWTSAPVIEIYGSSVRMTFGLITEDVAVRSSRCFPVRYSTEMRATVSGTGLTVTAIETGDELTPALVAIACNCIVLADTPRPSVGVNVSVDPVRVIGLRTG